MDSKLFTQAVTKFTAGLILVGLLLFLLTGTLFYWQAWLPMGILFVSMFLAGLFMLKKSPELLRKRLEAREEEDEQKAVILLSGVKKQPGIIPAWWMASFALPMSFNRRKDWQRGVIPNESAKIDGKVINLSLLR